MASERAQRTLDTGVTSGLAQRVYNIAKASRAGSRAATPQAARLVRNLQTDGRRHRTRETDQRGSRARKITLIQAMNPEWSDVYEALPEVDVAQPSAVIARPARAEAIQGSRPTPAGLSFVE
jgi:hypothetical protein